MDSEMCIRDSSHPGAFANADHDEAVGRLVTVIRRVRPQVLVTYPDERTGYNHPDHLQVHDISVPAFDAAGDADRYPEAGEPWQPLKMYFTVWSRARIEGLHAKFVEMGLESPYQGWSDRPSRDHLITTRIPIADHWEVRGEALRAAARRGAPSASCLRSSTSTPSSRRASSSNCRPGFTACPGRSAAPTRYSRPSA